MTRDGVLRAVLALAAFIAPFAFPWPYAALLAFLLALTEPLAGFACGMLADALYYGGGISHVPYGTLAGLAGALIAYLVRRFVKTRIMGE